MISGNSSYSPVRKGEFFPDLYFNSNSCYLVSQTTVLYDLSGLCIHWVYFYHCFQFSAHWCYGMYTIYFLNWVLLIYLFFLFNKTIYLQLVIQYLSFVNFQLLGLLFLIHFDQFTHLLYINIVEFFFFYTSHHRKSRLAPQSFRSCVYGNLVLYSYQ